MKRTKSALSLRQMAVSLHSSIKNQARKTRFPSYCLSLSEIQVEKRNNRIFILQKQISALQKKVSQSKSATINYSKQLDRYELMSRNIESIQLELQAQQENKCRLENQLGMLIEDQSSIAFNHQQKIAEKEYYQELIDTYNTQYPQESSLLTEIISKQRHHKTILQQISSINIEIEKKTHQLLEWKQLQNYDLNRYKLRNNLKIIRIELLNYEEKCNQFCQINHLKCLRQIHCLFFKQYSMKNGIDFRQADQGLELFLCRNGLVEQFSQFVKEYLVYNKPQCLQIEQYLLQLEKMEQIIKNSHSDTSNKMYNSQNEQLQILQFRKNQYKCSIQQIENDIKMREQKMEHNFGQDCIALIQNLRDKSNKYDIIQIKQTLKEAKKEQQKRISVIKKAYQTISHLEIIIDLKQTSKQLIVIKELIFQVQENIKITENYIKQTNNHIYTMREQKQQLQHFINSAIDKWRQRDQNKAKLKSLYQELSQAKYNNENTKQSMIERSFSFKQLPLKKSILSRERGQDELRNSQRDNKDSLISLSQRKSALSLSNPFKEIMRRQIEEYQPIIANCQMILSKKLASNKKQKEGSRNELKLKNKLTINSLKKTVEQKENILWQNRTKPKLNNKTSSSLKLSLNPSSRTQKGKIAQNQKMSLSKLIISRYNR